MHPQRSPLQSRPFGYAVAFATGIGTSAHFPLDPFSLATGLAVGFLAWRHPLALRHRLPPTALLALTVGGSLLLWVCLGASVERLHNYRFHRADLWNRVSGDMERGGSALARVRGWVVTPPFRNRGRWRFSLEAEELLQAGEWRSSSGRIRISVRDPESSLSLSPGDRLQLSVQLREPRSFGNPGAFNYSRHLRGRGVHFLGSVKSPRLVQFLSPGYRSPRVWGERLRQRLLRRLESALPLDEDRATRRFLEAVLLGWRRSRTGSFEELLRKSGVFYILSISGLHFGLLFATIRFFTRRLPGRDVLSPGIQIAVALFYVILSGGADPVMRAAISAGWVGWGRYTGRRISAWDAQAQSCLLLLAWRPLHLFDPGFQLSFLVTGGILAGGGLGTDSIPTSPRWKDGVLVSVRAWLSSLPLLASHFNQSAPATLILGFPAILFLSLSLSLGALCLVHPFSLAISVLNHSRALLASMCEAVLALPGASARVPTPSAPLLLSWTVLALARLVIQPPRRSMNSRVLGLSMFAAGSLFWLAPAAPAPDSLELLALDVGQGDAILIRTPSGENLLIDAGGFKGTDFDVGERVVLPSLLYLGIRRLDLVILTHDHQDHGGGLPAVLKDFAIGRLWMGGTDPPSALLSRIKTIAQRRKIPVRHPTRGALRCLGESCLEVLHPPLTLGGEAQAPNDVSLVLRITYRRSSLLLTGDIEEGSESSLLASGLLPRTDLLKVAHHGSNSSSGAPFLDAVQPTLAVISAGEGNLWGHPSPEVLRRFSDRGIPLLRTDQSGAIRLRSEGGRWVRVPLVP